MFLGTLTDQCRELPGGELTSLDRVLERKLYDIDRADVQAVTDGSEDGFLYARGFIVAMGRDFIPPDSLKPRSPSCAQELKPATFRQGCADGRRCSDCAMRSP